MKTIRHPKAATFNRMGIYENANTFRQIERKIARLKNPEERMEAFMVFAQAYLTVMPVAQAKRVWSVETQAPRGFATFRLHSHLIDGVIETATGELQVYHSLFCDKTEEIDVEALTPFFSVGGGSTHVLFTNVEMIPEEIDGLAKSIYVVSGKDLSRLTRDNLRAIGAWIAGKQPKVAKTLRKPMPRQQEACDNVCDLVVTQNKPRMKIIMPCGTGKTSTQLFVAEQLGVESILVLVPSLALVRQTLHEWLQHTSWQRPSFLCVCSDRTVAEGVHEFEIGQTELDFPVTNEAAAVSAFLASQTHGVKIIFTTYHSAPIVAEGMGGKHVFELGVFDEAHKTATQKGGQFAFALEDENLPIIIRTFWTATPRHWDIPDSKKDDDEARLVYSMDDEEIYGPTAYQMNFRDAVAEGIICDYEVVVSVVTSGMLDNIEKGFVDMGDGVRVKAREAANWISLAKAIERHGVGKVFSFHANVVDAQAFTGDGPRSVAPHIPSDFTVHNVNGDMSTAVREEEMQGFRHSARAVISNARCLTEGVDVPTVDLVAFFTKKRSLIDIVQATGRAMRRANGKKKGYILVPLYVEQHEDESIEDAVQRADFREVWAVLNAMREQDEAMAHKITRLRQERGERGSNGDQGKDHVNDADIVDVIGADGIDLELLRNAITTRCVDKLTSSWDEMFGQLLAYKEQYGDCNVPFGDPDNYSLSRWINYQRDRHTRGLLPRERYVALCDIGLRWKYRDKRSWEESYDILSAFFKANGHSKVTRFYEDQTLATWVAQQRVRRRKGKLSKERVRKLDLLKFDWGKTKKSWDQRYQELLTGLESSGKLDNGSTSWLSRQRKLARDGKLARDRLQKLRSKKLI